WLARPNERNAATATALQWIRSEAPASRPRGIDPESIVKPHASGPSGGGDGPGSGDRPAQGASGHVVEHDGGAVATAGAPDAGTGERRRAREVEARHGRLVP